MPAAGSEALRVQELADRLAAVSGHDPQLNLCSRVVVEVVCPERGGVSPARAPTTLVVARDPTAAGVVPGSSGSEDRHSTIHAAVHAAGAPLHRLTSSPLAR